MTKTLDIPPSYWGEPGARQMALARRGFRWQPRAGLWRKGRLALSDSAIDGMTASTFQALINHLDRHRYACCFEWGGPGWS
jgi:hypothetical protein